MRAIIQRVKQASVIIDDKEYSKINHGLLLFLGVHEYDTIEDVDYIVNKTSNLRIFTDEKGLMNLSLKDVGGQILVVSQFTLYGDARKGRRPNFMQAAKNPKGEELYQLTVEKLKKEIPSVETGEFGADMDICLINDGPVTIQLDSSKIY